MSEGSTPLSPWGILDLSMRCYCKISEYHYCSETAFGLVMFLQMKEMIEINEMCSRL